MGRFLQPDSIILDPYNPLDFDRYAYSRNNPINYNDPSGHWPEWFDWVQGAVYQYSNDMSLGAVDSIAWSYNVCMDCNRSDAYRHGQQVGQDLAIAQADADLATGAFVAGAGLAGVGPTVGGGLACALVTGGVCALPAGGALVVEAGMVVSGTTAGVYGGSVLAFSKGNLPGGHNTFPDAGEIAKRLGISKEQFHREIKPEILKDPTIAKLAQRIGAINPDIGVDGSDNIVLKNPKTGKTVSTDILLDSFGDH